MKGPITNLVIGCLAFFATQLAAQPTFTVTPQTITANAGDNITVQITVSNFTNILSVQYSMNWNAAVLQFVPPVGGLTPPALNGLTSANFGTNNVGNGQLTLSWFDPDVVGVSVPNGTVIYTLTFQVLSTAPTTISFSSNPTPIEVVNANGQNVTPVLQGASVNSGGGGGGGGGGGNVQGFAVIASDETVASGSPVCVDISVNDFNNIVSMQYTMQFDQTKLQFTGIQGFNLSGLTIANFGTSLVNQGKITLSWFDPNAAGITLSNGTVIYQVCFNAIGPNSCNNPSQFQFNGSQTPIEVVDGNGNNVPFQGIPGDIEICGGPPPGALTFLASQETAPNGSQVCVDFTVQNFNCVVSAQYSIHFNQAILQYQSVQNFGLPDLSASNFGTTAVNNGTLTFSWFDQTTNGQTVANGTVIFEVCFNVIGSTGQSSQITFNGNPTAIEVTDCNNATLQPAFTAGSVTVGSNCAGAVSISNNVVTNVACNGQNTGAIDITVTGGNNSYTYEWKRAGNPAVIATTQDVSGLSSGTYTVTVTSCGGQVTATGSYQITQPNAPLGATFQITNVACFGETSGAITVTPSGGTTSGTGCSGLTYAWSSGQTTQNLTGLAAGSRQVTITDCNGCQFVSNTLEVAAPPSAFSAVATAIPAKCFGASNGSIVVTASNGVSPYEYQLNNNPWQAGNTFGNLAPGSYTVKARDAFGCVRTSTVTVTAPTDITITTNATSATAGNCDGSITTTVTGGTPGGAPPGYTFSWSGPSGPLSGNPGANPSNLCPGTYCVTVTDFNGCTKTKCQLVTAPLLVTANKKDACLGTCNGEIALNVTGGVTPYTYQWTGGLTGTNPTGLCPGTYSVTVTSTASGQNQTLTVNISQATSIPQISNAVVSNPTSSTVCDGIVTINASSGGFGAPFIYNWSNGQTGNTATGLCDEVTYTVTVSDVNGCTGTASYTPDFVLVPIQHLVSSTSSCQTLSNGTLTVQVTNGGLAPFDFMISGPQNASVLNDADGIHTFTNLAPGSYNVTIVDGASGVDLQTITFTQDVAVTSLTITPTLIFPATVGQPGKIEIKPNGGQIPYSFQWSNGSAAQNPSNLAPGCYDVTIGDANGCYQVYEDICVGLFSASSNIDKPTCPDELTGSITAQPQGSQNSPFNYQWQNSNGQTVGGNSATLTGQPIGTYHVTITDALGVSISQTFQLASVSNLTVITEATSDFNGYDVRCNGGSSGVVAANAFNGVAPYSYLWNNGGTTPNLTGLQAGVYTVQVTDGEGCKISKAVEVIQPPALTNDLEGVFLGCPGTRSGQATITVNGGVKPYTYAWNTSPVQNGQTAILLEGGDYKVTVTDFNGCNLIGSVFVPEPDSMFIVGVSEPDSGGPNGVAIAQVFGGTWPYEFTWQGFLEKDSILSELLPGSYFVIATDANGCQVSKVIKVSDETQCGEVRTVITPEGDGRNEEFVISCLSRYSDNRLEIYNRWGQLVYEAKNYNDGNLWRGTNTRGNDVPDGVYFYVFEYLDPVNNQRLTKKGSVTVLRK